MKYLFTPNGQALLEALCFTRTLFAFDYDGTLAPIVRDINQARMRERTRSLLKNLSALAPVAVLSGRSLKDLRKLVTEPTLYLVGNHGLEGITTVARSSQPAAEICTGWKRHFGRMHLLRQAGGIEMEDKEFSLAVHYRKSRNKRNAKLRILELASRLQPAARIVLGKCVVNLVPVGAPHKGMALMEIMLQAQTRSAFYIGDDETDEDVFSVPDTGVVTVRVGEKQASQAQFFLRRQSEINRLLGLLLKFHRRNFPEKPGQA